MYRIALVLACTAACLDAPEDLAEVELEATTGTTITEVFEYEPISISGSPNSVRYFKLVVPESHDQVEASRSGPLYVGADVFMKRGALPTPSSYDCRALDGASRTCRIDYAAAGTYYIAVYGRSTGWANGYSNMTLSVATRDPYTPLGNNASIPIYNQYGFDYFFKLAVPANAASVTFTFTIDPEDDGALDLVVKRGVFATATTFDCKRVIDWDLSTMTGTCTFTNPPAGTYYVALLGNHAKVVGTFTARYRWGMTSSTNTASEHAP